MRRLRLSTYILFFFILGYLVSLPHRAFAVGQASLTMTPSSGVYEVGSTIDISFVLDTGGEAVNAVKSDILFPADKLQVVNPAASTSFISIWVTAPRYSNTDGTIFFEGGVPTPGVKTSSGVISTVTFRVKSPGIAVIRYAPTSKVLRNDGEGTNILASSSTASLTLKLPPPDGPIVSSPSHGDTTRWYNNPSVQFIWEAIDTATGYSYVFDQAPKTVPPETLSTTGISANVKATADGQWYFHLRAKTDIWGGVTTYPVRIDTTAPAAFSPKFDKSVMTTEDEPVVRFVTTDAASGVDHYEMKVVAKGDSGGSTLFVEAASPITLQAQPAGNYTVIVRAVDRSGNTAEGIVDFVIVGAGVPFYARVPFFRNPAVANITVVVLALLAIFVISLLLWRRLRVRETFRHDLSLLERDAQKKSEELQRELAELREAQNLFISAQPAPTPNTQVPVNTPPETKQPPAPIYPTTPPPNTTTPIPTIFQ